MFKAQWPSHGRTLAAHGIPLTGTKLSLSKQYRLIQKGHDGRALKRVLADKDQMQRTGVLTQWEAAEFRSRNSCST